MEYSIAKSINTTARRLKTGDPVAAGDDLSPHTFDDLQSRGFIAAKPTEPPQLHFASVKDED